MGVQEARVLSDEHADQRQHQQKVCDLGAARHRLAQAAHLSLLLGSGRAGGGADGGLGPGTFFNQAPSVL